MNTVFYDDEYDLVIKLSQLKDWYFSFRESKYDLEFNPTTFFLVGTDKGLNNKITSFEFDSITKDKLSELISKNNNIISTDEHNKLINKKED